MSYGQPLAITTTQLLATTITTSTVLLLRPCSKIAGRPIASELEETWQSPRFSQAGVRVLFAGPLAIAPEGIQGPKVAWWIGTRHTGHWRRRWQL